MPVIKRGLNPRDEKKPSSDVDPKKSSSGIDGFEDLTFVTSYFDTMMVDADMSTPPSAGLSKMPAPANTLAASGMAMTL